MRVPLGVMAVIGTCFGGVAAAQDICGNIRLSVAEQIDCRARTTNALGEADRQRTQQEYEERVRRATDALITPPLTSASPPPSMVPNTQRPAVPRAPVQPAPPIGPSASLPGQGPGPGEVKTPGGALPAGKPLVPDLTAPDPAASPLPPISPLPAAPSGSSPPR